MHVLTTNYSSHTMFKGPCLSPVDMWLQTTTWVHHDRPPPLWRHEGPDAAVLSVPRVWSSKKSLQYSLDRSSVQFATQ